MSTPEGVRVVVYGAGGLSCTWDMNPTPTSGPSKDRSDIDHGMEWPEGTLAVTRVTRA